MTAKRKEKINKLLGQFEGWKQSPRGGWIPPGGLKRPGSFCQEMPDYTADLNALARLEAKLPIDLEWEIVRDNSGYFANLRVEFKPVIWSDEQDTEAEARAEAIAQYLESQK